MVKERRKINKLRALSGQNAAYGIIRNSIYYQLLIPVRLTPDNLNCRFGDAPFVREQFNERFVGLPLFRHHRDRSLEDRLPGGVLRPSLNGVPGCFGRQPYIKAQVLRFVFHARHCSMPAMTEAKNLKRSIIAWCLYEAGSSAFSTVIVTFIFSVYFARYVVGDEVRGSALWSYAMGLSGVAIALLSPVVGALADHYGARKPFLSFFTMVCLIPCALLYFAAPATIYIPIALGLLVVGNIGLETSLVFFNAMLPHIAPREKIGRISGWAWAVGYVGGLLSLALALLVLVGLGSMQPLLHLAQDQHQNIRAVGPLVALWYGFLALPLVLWTGDIERSGLGWCAAARKGLVQLKETAINVRSHKNLLLFLIASALYRDGLSTVFAVGGLYAAGTFHMNFTEILIFAIGLNVTAGIGAAGFAFADDRWGSKRIIMTGIAGLLAAGVIILFLHDKLTFILLALVLGFFVGPAQAGSRTLAARLSPPDTVAQTFGLFALTGKATAFMGPFMFGLATDVFHSQRAGMATIVLFWLAGLALLTFVKEERK